MSTHHIVLIGGAVALLWYARRHKMLHAAGAGSDAVAAANAPDASHTYTTQQAAQSARWYAYPGHWAGSVA